LAAYRKSSISRRSGRGKLLYDGPWVAERYHVAGKLIEQQPDAVLPVIRDVLQKAPSTDAVAAFDASTNCSITKCSVMPFWPGCLCINANLSTPVTLAELAAEPVKRNADLGYTPTL
jgi:allophanate hydrolase